NSGTVVLGHATNTLPDTNAINVSGGTLDIAGNTDTVGAIIETGGGILGSTGTLFPSSVNLQAGFLGNIGGAIGVPKTTAGAATLGANTYSGDTTISAGILTFNSTTGTAGNGAGQIILNGGSLAATTDRTSGSSIPNPLTIAADSAIV